MTAEDADERGELLMTADDADERGSSRGAVWAPACGDQGPDNASTTVRPTSEFRVEFFAIMMRILSV